MAKNKQKDGTEVEAPVVPVSITQEMRESYLDYAMSVITGRALPDVRDGLKPVQRRILYAMNEIGLSYSAKFRKSAAVVGDVLGKYHPHGDSAVYDTMTKMAQTFSYRYPLVFGQGNFGSIDGDAPAAMRYTEAKMARIAGEMLRDIEKKTVNTAPNYDGTKQEPIVLPAGVPNLLLNGTLGIAVGMATNIPPHNLNEVADAITYRIDNEKSTTEDLLEFIKGPDFPMGGIIFNKKDIQHAYASGRGGVVCRGEAEILDDKVPTIVITSIPFRVNKATMIERIADLVREKKIDGIKALRDESTSDIRVVIELKTGSYPQKVLNYLYKHTDLEQTYHFNMVALVDGVPQTLSLKSIIDAYIGHRVEIVTRRTQFDLQKAEDRAHILAGLKMALDHIDKIIKLIKASKDASAAHAKLMQEFKFSERQATAILEMRLQKLAGLERKAIEDELKEKLALIKSLKALLGSPKKIRAVVKTEVEELKEKYGDPRRTKVVKGRAGEITTEDMIPDEDSILVYTKGGYIKRTNPDEYRAQKRGGIGVVDLNTKEEDFITIFVSARTHDDLLFFTDLGKVYKMKMYDIPEGRRATKGKSIMNFLQLGSDERVTSIVPMPKLAINSDDISLMMITKRGVAKKVAAASFADVRRNGLIAITLGKGDTLHSSLFVRKGDTVILVTKDGQSIHFKDADIRQMGRSAAGVRGMKIGEKDKIVGASVVPKGEKEAKVMVMSETGYGKLTPITEYKVQKRDGSGIKTAKLTPKTGVLMASGLITQGMQEVVAISRKGVVIRTSLEDISTLGRQTQGVRIMKLRAGDKIASLVTW